MHYMRFRAKLEENKKNQQYELQNTKHNAGTDNPYQFGYGMPQYLEDQLERDTELVMRESIGGRQMGGINIREHGEEHGPKWKGKQIDLNEEPDSD
uniref:Uncharacterized protein n=1 Tax=Meloidogyne javanica TaxID=6303 RepID=A0A915N0H7_MELJA